MVAKDRFGATALLTPGFYTSRSAGSGTVAAYAMRSAYTHAQTRGRMVGCQTYIELPFDGSAPARTISATDFTLVARHYSRIPPYAKRLYYRTRYRVYWDQQGEVLVGHRMDINDGTDTDTGPEVYDQRSAVPLSWQVDVGTDSLQTDPGDTGVFNIYDTPFQESECFVDVADVDLTQTLRISLYAFATTIETSSATAESSDLTSNTVSAVVPAGHSFVSGQYIWTDGFDINVPRGSPEPLTSVTVSELQWTLNAANDASFGEGVVYSTSGFPLPYRPSPGCCWWEV